MRGAQFRAERVAREMSQSEAAAMLRVDVTDMQLWEHDKLKVPAWAAKALTAIETAKGVR